MSVTDAPGAERTSRIDEWMARGDEEDVHWSGHPRVTTTLPAVVVGLALVAVGVVVAATQNRLLVALLVPVGLAVAVGAYLRVVNTRYVVTDRALYRKTGVLSRRVERVSLSRVQNSSFTQGVLGSLFDYGTVSVEAAGGGSIAFADVDDPRALRTLIERQVGSDDDIPGDVDQWTTVLGEVRRLRSAVERRGR
ncbi:PH domain-containing protein [Halogranum amylolyticum]|uniref:PH domain-containing protein n=1 Tax=Halogranum amylolyticum TaxID=660520 RepID=A0A1H8W939_9EURY|nr:PH domain-containing protein [Halogranum amylolyticum]SEP24150.1 PH domain-containing protein [Halogranum amylolyticum]